MWPCTVRVYSNREGIVCWVSGGERLLCHWKKFGVWVISDLVGDILLCSVLVGSRH